MILRLFLALFLLVNTVPPAFGETAPRTKLENVKAKLSKENQEKERLKYHANKMASELKDIKNNLTKLGRDMRKNEDRLKYTEERITSLEQKKTELTKTLTSERVSIVKLILMLERIRKTPPEVMIARPDAPYHTAQSALLMENIIPSVKRDSARLKNNLETLEELGTELKVERFRLNKETKELYKKRKTLLAMIGKKETLYEGFGKDLKARELSIRTISLKAQSLKELITQIKTEEKKEIHRQKSSKIFRRKPSSSMLFTNGEAQLPVSGIIRSSFHDKDEYGAKSNGIVIEGSPDGLVIAPMGGKIQFIGAFKRFSNIVIIEHNGGYHSLIAGLGKINAVMGDHVKSGEPIGLLPNSTLISRPKLYYELRKDASPVDPSIKFSDLGA